MTTIRRFLTSAALTYIAVMVTVCVVVLIATLAVAELTGGNWVPVDAPAQVRGAR